MVVDVNVDVLVHVLVGVPARRPAPLLILQFFW